MNKQLTLGSLFDGSGGFPLGGMKAYRESLIYDFNEATQQFERARKEAIECLEKMDWSQAENFGAGYASHIEDITIAAAKMRALGMAVHDFDCQVNRLIVKHSEIEA